MTQDEIIRMAREAGFREQDGVIFPREHEGCINFEVERFAALVAEATKEKAAKVCEDEATKCEKAAQACIENDEPDEVSAVRSTGWKLMVCAAAIRSMK